MDSFIPTVLIVDDSAPLRILYSTYLKDENVNVYSVSSGRDAIDFISSHRPDVIFLDLYLPDISGFEVLNYVKKQNLDARVIMLTGSGSVDDAVEAMRLGAFDFIVKPIDSARLVHRLLRDLACYKGVGPLLRCLCQELLAGSRA